MKTIKSNFPAEAYHASNGLSKSGMVKLLKSPAHYKAYLNEEKKEPTKAMQIGTATHCAILEPALFDSTVAIRPAGIDGRTKEGKQWATENEGKIILSQDEAKDIQGMSASFFRHPFYKQEVQGRKQAIEESIWEELDNGVVLKARPDLWIENTIIDIKTTEDASEEAFTKTCASLKYYLQAAHYLKMADADRFVFVAIERTAPYAVNIFELDQHWINLGNELRERAITIMHECSILDQWPAYSNNTKTLAMPKWVANQ